MHNPNSDQFRYCPFCGEERLRAACEKSFVCGACDRLFFMNVAAAVAALISDREGAVLVTERKYDPAAGTWDLPGGFTDPRESVEEALRREVKEEVGIDPGRLTYLCSLPNEYVYKGVRYATVDLFFSAMLETRPELKLSDEIADAHWVARDQLDPSRFGLGSIRKLIQQEVERVRVGAPYLRGKK
jgi:8-oxo-dGTP pyrophosphatase MutT (NUDIX family)